MAKIRITNIKEVQNGIVKEAVLQVNKILKAEFAQKLEPLVRELFLKYFRRNKVPLGLTGFYAGDEEKDYQAIFGLTDTLGQQAVDEMIVAVNTALDIDFKISYSNVSNGQSRITYSLIFYNENLEEAIRDIPSKSYDYDYKVVTFAGNRISNRSERNFTLPWLEWLFDGAQTEGSLEFDVTQDDESRSGRAIMHRNGPGWDFMGVNFVEEIVTNPKFIDDLEKLLGKGISKRIQDSLGK